MIEKILGAACSMVYSVLSLLYFPIFISRIVGKDVPLVAQWFMSLIFPCAFSLGVDQVYDLSIGIHKTVSFILTFIFKLKGLIHSNSVSKVISS